MFLLSLSSGSLTWTIANKNKLTYNLKKYKLVRRELFVIRQEFRARIDKCKQFGKNEVLLSKEK